MRIATFPSCRKQCSRFDTSSSNEVVVRLICHNCKLWDGPNACCLLPPFCVYRYPYRNSFDAEGLCTSSEISSGRAARAMWGQKRIIMLLKITITDNE